MSIIVSDDHVFHLQTKNTSYIMRVVDGKYLAHVYWGRKMPLPDLDNAQLNRWLCFAPVNENGQYSLDYITQEYPVGCGTDYRIPAISAVYADGSRTVELHYAGCCLTPANLSFPDFPRPMLRMIPKQIRWKLL